MAKIPPNRRKGTLASTKKIAKRLGIKLNDAGKFKPCRCGSGIAQPYCCGSVG